MKKLVLQKSLAVPLLLALATLFLSFSAVAQAPVKKVMKVVMVTDSLYTNTSDSTMFAEEFSIPEDENAVWESMDEVQINLDSINCEVRKAISNICIEIDSIPTELDVSDTEFLDHDEDIVMDKRNGKRVSRKVEIKRVDNRDPKELEETLRKLELEGKITTKGEYTGVQTISVTEGDSLKERVWLQPKGKKEWIDAKTGLPVKMKHRVMRSPRHSRIAYCNSDSTNLKGKTRNVYITRGGGNKMIVRTIEGDSRRSTDTIIVRRHRGNRPHRMSINSTDGSEEEVEVTVICNDSTNSNHRRGKNHMVWVMENDHKQGGNPVKTKKVTIRVEASEELTPEEKSLLEKSGFIKEKEDKLLPAQNLSIFPNPTAGQFKVVFIGECKGSLVVKIADGAGKVLVNDKNTIVNGSFEKAYSLETPIDGIYFVQVTLDGKSVTKKILIKN